MFSIIFPENSRIWVNLLPPDDLMSSSSTWKHSGPSHLPKKSTSSVKMPPTHQKIWPIMNMFPVLVSNNWYVGQTNADNLQPVFPFHKPPTGCLACRIFSLSCCDCNTPSSEMGWSRCHTSNSRNIYRKSCSFGTLWPETRNGSPLALRCELHLTKHPGSCSKQLEKLLKRKKRHQANVPPKKF